ncbi:hypothetical protein LUZ60_012883 [Juncus effusus]|nr:hypothetical protein LUZ60_012883 [Juncus effusus]
MLEPITSSATHLSLITNHKLPNGIRKIPRIIKCCSSKRNNGGPINYYQVLGVSTDSSRKEIKEAYRRLQKQHHPDIAGDNGHEYTLLLNEAYKALVRGKQSRNSSNKSGGSNFFDGMGYSSWNGPVRDRALFVDENKCIGCRECVHHAG